MTAQTTRRELAGGDGGIHAGDPRLESQHLRLVSADIRMATAAMATAGATAGATAMATMAAAEVKKAVGHGTVQCL